MLIFIILVWLLMDRSRCFIYLSSPHFKDNVLSDNRTGRQDLGSLACGFRGISIVARGLLLHHTCRVAAPDLTTSADGGIASSAEHGYGRILARAIFLSFLFPFVRDEYPPRAYFAFIPPRMNALFSFGFSCSYFHYKRVNHSLCSL